MDIHEYQAKEILGTYEIPVPRGRVCLTADQVERAAKMMGGHCVVKAQIYAGGRGKAGGVNVVHHPEQAQELAKELFARKLVTPQTGPEGLRVRRILVEEAVEIAREFYLSITLDRATGRNRARSAGNRRKECSFCSQHCLRFLQGAYGACAGHSQHEGTDHLCRHGC